MDTEEIIRIIGEKQARAKGDGLTEAEIVAQVAELEEKFWGGGGVKGIDYWIQKAALERSDLTLADGDTWIEFAGVATGRTLFTIALDGKVTLAPDLTLGDVTALPLPYLRLLREIVNTAIYDKERE
jgi:hypothetical protein